MHPNSLARSLGGEMESKGVTGTQFGGPKKAETPREIARDGLRGILSYGDCNGGTELGRARNDPRLLLCW